MGITVYPFWGMGEPGSGGGSADARPVALDGPLSLYVGQSASWQITDFDVFSEYLIQVDAGVASLDGDTIDYTAPPSAGEATLTITVNGVARALAIEVRPAVVMAPAITAPLDGAIEIGETPTITTAAFSVVGAADTHIASRYRVWSADGQTLIYDSGPTADLVQHVVPAGYLQAGEVGYLLEAAHQGQSLGWSEYGARIAITTDLSFFDPYTAAPGLPMHGGFFVGVMRYSDGDYLLIDAGKAAETSLTYKTASAATAGTDSYHDGLANSNAMNDAGHPAAQYCRAYRGGGFDDWYLPARDERELCYRRLKPGTASNQMGSRSESGNHGDNANSVPIGASYTTTAPAQTSAAAFRSGGAEAFNDAGTWYWTSTQYAPYTGGVWIQRCSDGGQNYNYKTYSFLVRPVRRVKI